MTPHEFAHPARVEEVRPEDRLAALEPEIAPAVPLATDDGTPVGGPGPLSAAGAAAPQPAV
jgi:hypothetical protein